jgi:hypothetical protein
MKGYTTFMVFPFRKTISIFIYLLPSLWIFPLFPGKPVLLYSTGVIGRHVSRISIFKSFCMQNISGAVRISIPAATAANLKTLKSSLVNIAEKLGCKACFSGADCFFHLEHDYAIDEKLVVSASRGILEKRSAAFSLGSQSKTLRVALSPKAGFSLETITAAVEKIAELSGHPACATGCNIFFEHFLDDMRSFAVNEKGLIRQF